MAVGALLVLVGRIAPTPPRTRHAQPAEADGAGASLPAGDDGEQDVQPAGSR
jgi:hypothetical protein